MGQIGNNNILDSGGPIPTPVCMMYNITEDELKPFKESRSLEHWSDILGKILQERKRLGLNTEPVWAGMEV